MAKTGRIFLYIVAFFLGSFYLSAQKIDLEPYGPIPSENQWRWQQMEYYGFIHFSLNTYTDQSWGYGNEDIKLFNPSKLDCRNWARICKQAGMKGVILTAKHHCGFCLWPSKYTEYSVKNAPWKNGKGDVVREMADACKEYGLKLGIYLSPWDRNRADYGSPDYIQYFRNQLTELLTQYGPIFEIWFDGANGGSGYYGGANETRIIDRKTYYDWANTYKLVRELQPNIVIWNDGGERADLRWVGTESGSVGETNWSLLNSTGDVPYDMLHYGVENGNAWVPGEVNTSIRPEWFYHPSEDKKVKTVPQLMETYYNSIGRNGSLLLNFPIMPDGRIHPTDEKNALAFAKARKAAFSINLAENKPVMASNIRGRMKTFSPGNVTDHQKSTFWATDDSVKSARLTIDLGRTVRFNRFLVQEYIQLGQRVKAFGLEAFIKGQWKELAKGTTIGYKRILCFPSVKARKVRLYIKDAKASLAISNIGIYNAPQILTSPSFIRNQEGEISIKAADMESQIYYTTNGSKPGLASKKYKGPFLEGGKPYIRAIAYDPNTKRTSPETKELFGVSRKSWKIVDPQDQKVQAILDGDPSTAWHQSKEKKMPQDLIIDLGQVENVSGFKYLPDQTIWNPGIIAAYEFFVSENNRDWKLVQQGEFPNIKNNPLWQTVKFPAQKTRYFKLSAIKNTENTDEVGYAEIDIMTQ